MPIKIQRDFQNVRIVRETNISCYTNKIPPEKKSKLWNKFTNLQVYKLCRYFQLFYKRLDKTLKFKFLPKLLICNSDKMLNNKTSDLIRLINKCMNTNGYKQCYKYIHPEYNATLIKYSETIINIISLIFKLRKSSSYLLFAKWLYNKQHSHHTWYHRILK